MLRKYARYICVETNSVLPTLAISARAIWHDKVTSWFFVIRKLSRKNDCANLNLKRTDVSEINQLLLVPRKNYILVSQLNVWGLNQMRVALHKQILSLKYLNWMARFPFINSEYNKHTKIDIDARIQYPVMRNLSLMRNSLIRPRVFPVVLRVGAEGQNGARSVFTVERYLAVH